MKYALCSVPAAAVRLEPSHRTEMVNQLLYGEALEVLEKHDEWFRVRSLYDNYEGWVTWHLIGETDPETAQASPAYFVKDTVAALSTDHGTMQVPMGTVLNGFDPDRGRMEESGYFFKGTYSNTDRPATIDEIIETARLWLHAPYLWGGKTVMGVDCSGFVQTVFKVFGLKLFRDAFQQAEQGVPVTGLDLGRAGDLAFFHNEKGRIIHVGLLLGPEQIIHASGSVRIDPIDPLGITHLQTGRRTHQLHSIRRIVNSQ